MPTIGNISFRWFIESVSDLSEGSEIWIPSSSYETSISRDMFGWATWGNNGIKPRMERHKEYLVEPIAFFLRIHLWIKSKMLSCFCCKLYGFDFWFLGKTSTANFWHFFFTAIFIRSFNKEYGRLCINITENNYCLVRSKLRFSTEYHTNWRKLLLGGPASFFVYGLFCKGSARFLLAMGGFVHLQASAAWKHCPLLAGAWPCLNSARFCLERS